MPHFLAQANPYRKRNLLLIVLLSISFFAQAQSHKALAKAGKEAMDRGDCHTAMSHFEAALSKRANVAYHYYFAQAAQECNANIQAEKAYKEALDDFPDAGYQLGLVQKGLGAYAEAKSSFEHYLQKNPNGSYSNLATVELRNCTYALSLKDDPAFKIKNLGKKINSDYSEFAPVKRGDTLYYSSFRFINKKDKHTPQRKIAKTVYSTKGQKGKIMKYGFNSRTKFTANLCFLPDNTGVYYTQCEYNEGQNIHCDLYFKARKKRGWKKGIKLHINTDEYTSTHPAYYTDSQTNKDYLIFSSDRPGGVGKSDIWMAPIKKDHQLGEPFNLKVINTPGDELSPYFDSIRQELTFSSTRHLNIGGLDVFKISAPSLPIENAEITPLPQPINSPANDIFFVPNRDGKSGFLASNRTGAKFIDKQNQRCCNDLYDWTYDESKATPPISDTLLATAPVAKKTALPKSSPPNIRILKEHKTEPAKTTKTPIVDKIPPKTNPPKIDSLVFAQTTQPPISLKPTKPRNTKQKPTITFTKEPPSSNYWSMLPIKLYFDNDQPDNRTTSITTKKTYLETYHLYRKRRLAFIQSYCQPLTGHEKEDAENSITSFFRQDLELGRENLRLFSEKLLLALKNGDKIQIILKGYTSPRAESKYNDFLASRRIASVQNHFKAYKNGLLQTYLQSGQLSFSVLPLGETSAPSGINDSYKNRRKSIYSIEASLERRVEIVKVVLGY